jgi:hypothetical protein
MKIKHAIGFWAIVAGIAFIAAVAAITTFVADVMQRVG